MSNSDTLPPEIRILEIGRIEGMLREKAYNLSGWGSELPALDTILPFRFFWKSMHHV